MTARRKTIKWRKIRDTELLVPENHMSLVLLDNKLMIQLRRRSESGPFFEQLERGEKIGRWQWRQYRIMRVHIPRYMSLLYPYSLNTFFLSSQCAVLNIILGVEYKRNYKCIDSTRAQCQYTVGFGHWETEAGSMVTHILACQTENIRPAKELRWLVKKKKWLWLANRSSGHSVVADEERKN